MSNSLGSHGLQHSRLPCPSVIVKLSVKNNLEVESLEIDPHKYIHLIFDKAAKAIKRRKSSFLNKSAETLEIHMGINKQRLFFPQK